MEPLEFDEVIDLLNRTKVVQINPQAKINEAGQWSLYNGEYVVPGDRIEFEILYFYSRATRDGALRAKKNAFSSGKTQVVYATSLEGKARFLRELFSADAKQFVSLKEYLSSFLRNEMAEYVSKLSGLTAKFYIDPKIETPSGVERRFPNPVELLVGEPVQASDDASGVVGVLLAEPGQGKTFMCDHIVSRLAAAGGSPAKDLTPIYVASEQWKTMSSEDLSSLWKTLGHSFSHYEAPIGWLQGSEGVFLRVTLKAGLFRLVFDGLDEYVLRNKGEVSAVDVLQLLCDLASQTGTRMLVTARTTFWESEVKPYLVDTRDMGVLRFLREYTIKPFDRNHARNYFQLRFPNNNGAITRATDLFVRLSSDTQKSFAGRGFVLRLIADLYQRDPLFDAGDFGQSPMWWLMIRLCEREQLRQALPLTADQQLSALTQFVRDVAITGDASSQTLELAVYVANPALTDTARADCIKRLSSHPIINLRETRDEWFITEGQAEVALMANYVRHITTVELDGRELATFSEKIRLEHEVKADLAAMLVDDLIDRSGSHVAAQRLVSILVTLSRQGESLGPRLGFLIALKYVDLQPSSGGSKKQRVELLEALLPGQEMRNLIFSGSVSRYDFSGRTFNKCRFDNVSWTNCQFDSTTKFIGCELLGGTAEYCTGFGEASWIDHTGDSEGLAFVRTLQVASGTRRYSQMDLKEDMTSVLRKFIPRAGYAFKTVRADHLEAGPIRKSKFRSEIIDGIRRSLLEFHAISGVARGGYHIREDCEEAVRFLAQNNVFTGPVQDCFIRLCGELKLK